jgi:excisionase family DNA binding protein
MTQEKGVSVIPVMRELATQTAVGILGVSRPFLVGLIERGEIPFHKVGTHRRIYLKDVLDYSLIPLCIALLAIS